MLPRRDAVRRAASLAAAALLVALFAAQRPAALTAERPAALAAEGIIRGVVDIRRRHAPTEPRAASAAIGMPPHRSPESRPAVVYLDAAPRGAFEPDGAARARMDQLNQAFVPHVLAITAGTTVDFPNSDVTFHNVFSLSKTRSFDLGRYSRGRSRSVRFDRPGVVQVFCDIHSHMNAYILVFAHRFFATTGDGGRYAIGHVPPGSYTLVVWYEGEVRESRTVVVPDSGGVVDAAFVVR